MRGTGRTRALSAEAVRETIKRFRAANDNFPLVEDEEATADQIQGVKVKWAHDVVPYADFGVLRPYGQWPERALKFHAKFWDPVSGDFVTKELPGPASHAEWLRSWEVYSFILVVLDAVTRARLERYASKVASLVDQYGNMRGNCRWIVALADQLLRSERLEIIRRNLQAAYTEGRLGDAGRFDPDKPWDAVFLAAAASSGRLRWRRRPCLYIARVKDKDDLMDPGHHVEVAGAASGSGSALPLKGAAEGSSSGSGNEEGYGGREQVRRDGRRVWRQGEQGRQGRRQRQAAQGTGGRDAAGCPTQCPNGRVHQCKVCGASDHKDKDCPRV